MTRRGEWITPLLVGFIDDRSRYLCHAQWYGSEGTEELVHDLRKDGTTVWAPAPNACDLP